MNKINSDDFWNVYESAFGYNPSNQAIEDFEALSLDGQIKYMDFMQPLVEANIKEETDQRMLGIKEFWGDLSKMLEIGASDKRKALQWLFDGVYRGQRESYDIERWLYSEYYIDPLDSKEARQIYDWVCEVI